jgi:phenylacetate-coenzyme A ligase PaaK-like adenylate-forming protein
MLGSTAASQAYLDCLGYLEVAIRQAATAPFYATREWQAALAAPTARLIDLPRITKSQLREHSPEGFLPSGLNIPSLLARGLIEEESTSGTSGASVRVVFGKTWWAEQERRTLVRHPLLAELFGAHAQLRRAVLTTPGCSGVSCYNRWLSLNQRTQSDSLFVNQSRIPFTLGEEKLAGMAQEVGDWRPTFLDVDPVHGAWFALHCERHGLHFPTLRFILTSYEYTSVSHRAIMERVFRVPVIDLYGSSETGHLLIEYDGVMRTVPETAMLESTAVDGIGELLVTTLTNPYLPLLRYEVGDYVERTEDGYWLHGRKRDALCDAHGRILTTRMVDQNFAGESGIAHYQLRQKADGSAHLLLVPAKPADNLSLAKAKLTAELGRLLGTPVTAECVALIAPEDSGKFRLTLCEAA